MRIGTCVLCKWICSTVQYSTVQYIYSSARACIHLISFEWTTVRPLPVPCPVYHHNWFSHFHPGFWRASQSPTLSPYLTLAYIVHRTALKRWTHPWTLTLHHYHFTLFIKLYLPFPTVVFIFYLFLCSNY